VAELRRPVLLYDAHCRLCRFAARLVVRLDRADRLAYLPLDGAEAEPLLRPLPEAERASTWRLALPDGRLVGRGRGATGVLEALGHRRSARALAALPDGVVELGYDLVARHRGRLGRLFPDGPAPRRFP
jgi:predicted DCC family thiol-disulfide oxidoreductase YuxK